MVLFYIIPSIRILYHVRCITVQHVPPKRRATPDNSVEREIQRANQSPFVDHDDHGRAFRRPSYRA